MKTEVNNGEYSALWLSSYTCAAIFTVTYFALHNLMLVSDFFEEEIRL